MPPTTATNSSRALRARYNFKRRTTARITRSSAESISATSQIAVRGTDGYIVTGPTGTDFYCVDCKPGDVTVTVGSKSYQLRTGDQAIIVGSTRASAKVEVVAKPCGNPAAIALSDGKLGAAIPPDQRIDTTGALKGDPMKPVAALADALHKPPATPRARP
jgi:hypothetical protein